MSEKYKPHVLVLPEDDANTSLATGFSKHFAIDLRAIQVLPCAGGWPKVRKRFLSDHIRAMRKYQQRHMVLLVDFDQQNNRFEKMTEGIPEDIAERVFVIGVWSEPEEFRKENLGNPEEVGLTLAEECFDEKRVVWNHKLFIHNAHELERMTAILRPILFP